MSILRRQLFCPSCLIQVDRDRVEVRDTLGERTGEVRPLDARRDDRQALDDLQKGLRLTCRAGHVLPDDYGRVPCETVALVGPSLSMKTHFLAITAYEALEGTAYSRPNADTTLSFSASPATEDLLREEYFTLLEDHRALGRTIVREDDESPVRHPICLEVTGARAAVAKSNIWQKHLLLFDAPGERVAGTAQQQAKVSPYLRDAAAVAFFVDLLQIAEVRPHLHMDIPPDYTGRYSSTPINKASRLIRDSHRSSGVGAADVDALVVLSKADVLQHARGPLLADLGVPGHALASLSDAENSALAEKLLSIYAPAVLTKASTGFRSVTFHLASAIGSQPSDNGAVDDVRPFGCDAVFREILRATGMVTR